MSNKFNQKVIWITGASAGIGEALAIAFSKAGGRLILSARRESELQRVKERCARPEEHLVMPLDMLETDQFKAKVDQVIKQVGQVDILINNAGVSQRSLAKETDLAVDEQLMRINYLGTVGLTKALLPHMLERQQGQVVAVSSIAGKVGTPYRSGYCASKHALHGFFDSMRAELHDDGISVTLICPGYIKTDVSVNALTGNGSKLGSMDPKTEAGMTPTDLANQILRAVANKKDEAVFGGSETAGVLIKRLFPRLMTRIVRRVSVR